MVSMGVLIRTFISGIHTHPGSRNSAYHLRMELSDGGCFTNLVRNCHWKVVPGQSFWITVYLILWVWVCSLRYPACNAHGGSNCVNHNACLENVIKHGNFVTVSNPFHVYYYRTNLSCQDSHLPVCTMEEDILKVSIVMYLKKGHPLLERINKVTRGLVEAGMMVKWRNEFM